MPRIIEIETFQFDELSDRAKERARDWWKNTSYQDTEFYDSVISDAVEIAGRLGIEFKDHASRTAGGREFREPNLYWSGFASQGDGASYDGRYTPKSDAGAAVRERAPKDEKLFSLADRLGALAAQHGADFVIEISKDRRARYEHSGTMDFEVLDAARKCDMGEAGDKIADAFSGPLREFADWIYGRLESANDHYFSDENVSENIRANEYAFTADGRRCAALD